MKAGFAGDDAPKLCFASLIGQPKHLEVMTDSIDEEKIYIGDEAQQMRGVLTLSYPIQRGVVTNWEDMELLWQYTMDQLGVKDTTNHPVLLTEPPMNPKKNRENLVTTLFELASVPAVYIANQAVLSMYSMYV